MFAEHESLPPSYNPDDSLAFEPGSELPTYSLASARPTAIPPIAPKEYSCEINNFWGKSWATLTLLGDPRLSRNIPIFLEGSPITGSVKLNLRVSDPIKSIDVLLRKFLWKTSMGDPRAADTSSGNWEEKLRGEYHWPFSIEIPELPVGSEEERFRLPHSFADRFSRVSTEYYIVLRINRGKLRSDDSRSSRLRQLAYQNNTQLPGPYSDPEGWHALDPVQIRGKTFGERTVNAKCTVFLAKPLCYTRGTFIPCAMTIETEDSQAADVLVSMKSSAVYFQRCVRCSFGYTATNISRWGQATWWPSSDALHLQNSSQRHIMGEIHLKKELQPSAEIKEFQVEYAVAVFPPTAVGFKPQSTDPLIVQSVEIVTGFPQGPRPKPVTTPVYEYNDASIDRYYKSVSVPDRRLRLSGP
ncbi:hypothetical protein B0H19DRAFT_1072969 [Mycena capillaripes]|nr:hypothetical protein B0H19DRAFT_1072969 [Mycena capillaripes]